MLHLHDGVLLIQQFSTHDLSFAELGCVVWRLVEKSNSLLNQSDFFQQGSFCDLLGRQVFLVRNWIGLQSHHKYR